MHNSRHFRLVVFSDISANYHLWYNRGMNKLVMSGFNIWKIFIKNKLASSIMMFVGGVMMLIGAINGHGNDTKSMPALITAVGILLSFWSFYRIGYIKSDYDKQKDRQEKVAKRQAFFSQILEALIYILVVVLGFFLLLNEGFTNKALNLMSGFFSILNGVFGAIYVFKHRENKSAWWKFRIALTVIEFALGIYFIFASDSIEIGWYIAMGALTTVAGAIEVVSSFTADNLRNAANDGKDIVRILKNENKKSELDQPDEAEES